MDIYTPKEEQLLLKIACDSIQEGLTSGQLLKIRARDYSNNLRKKRACFVTLKKKEVLRGCIGNIRPLRPLVEGVVSNAFFAAFRDSRFNGLTPEEYEECSLSLSILSLPELMKFDSEDDLIKQLQPGIDGLILTEGGSGGVFLPFVWEKLPNPKVFLTHLKKKAGLSDNYWSNTLEVKRFTTSVMNRLVLY